MSPIDKWFVGPVARINREALGVPSEKANITSAIAKARAALDRWDQTVREVSSPIIFWRGRKNQRLTYAHMFFDPDFRGPE